VGLWDVRGGQTYNWMVGGPWGGFGMQERGQWEVAGMRHSQHADDGRGG
jgi:hypothetical protein